MTIAELLNTGDPLVAVVGATDNPTKYGSVIYRDLRSKGFRVVPINRRRDTVCGDAAFADLGDLPEAPDIVNVVVPPDQTLEVLSRSLELGYTRVWLQPGASDQAVHEYLDAHDFDYLVDACIMVRTRVRTAG